MTRVGSLFTGYGGLDLAVTDVLDNATVAWHAETDPAACAVLAHHWPTIPNHGDVTAVDWTTVEPVDVLTGGFPCQDVSLAGRRTGMRPATRSGLWTHMADAVDQLRPSLVVIENVRGLLSVDAASDLEPCPWCLGNRPGRSALRALGAVLGDLADLRYDAIWRGVPASDVGVPHGRFRVFVLARPAPDADRSRLEVPQPARRHDVPHGGTAPDADHIGRERDRPTRQRRDRPPHSRRAAPDPESIRRIQRRTGTTRLLRRPHAPIRRDDTPIDWAQFTPAVQRWEHLTGRPAPHPTSIGKRGGRQLSARFVEWLMGLDNGYITDVAGVTRNAQLRTLGNGVVPHHAAAAIRALLAEWETQP